MSLGKNGGHDLFACFDMFSYLTQSENMLKMDIFASNKVRKYHYLL